MGVERSRKLPASSASNSIANRLQQQEVLINGCGRRDNIGVYPYMGGCSRLHCHRRHFFWCRADSSLHRQGIYIYIYIYMEYAVLSLFLFQHLCDFFLSVFEEKGPEATIRSLTENQGRSDTLFLYFSISLSSLQMPLICFLFPGSSGFLNHAFNGG